FADAAGEEFGRFKNRRADFVEVVGTEDIADGGLDEIPQRRIRREQVARSSRSFDHLAFSRQPSAVRQISRVERFYRSRLKSAFGVHHAMNEPVNPGSPDG